MYNKIATKAHKLLHKCYEYSDTLDSFIHRNKKNRISFLLISLLFIGVTIFILNLKTPMHWDDFKLVFVWPQHVVVEESGEITNPTERISSFYDIIVSQYNHYHTWGGRTVVHIIAQFLLYIDPIKADILNTIIYLIYVILIYYHIIGRGKHDLLLFLGVNFLIYFLQPVFGETILWLTGSANYLWGSVFILLFLLPYRLYERKLVKYTFLKCVGLFILGIIAGWTNENTATAGIFLAIVFLLYFYHKKWKIPVWAITGFIGAVIGYIIMIAAPGNFLRAEMRTEGMSINLFHLSYRFLTSTELLFQYLGVFNLIGFILIILVRRYSKTINHYNDNLFFIILYFTGTLVAIYVMLFSPFFPPRAWFGAITFNTISFGIIIRNLNYSYNFLKQIRLGMFYLGIVLFAFTYYEAYKDVNRVNNEWKKRITLIQGKKGTGEKIKLPWIQSRTKFALSDPPFLRNVLQLYYEEEVEIH